MKKSFRPTKAASKRRRDMMNMEISCVRNVLPFTELQCQRLSQLQVMSLSSAYVSLNNFVAEFVTKNDCSEEILRHLNITQILPGFLLVLASDGRVLYVSDNVSDYLGYSAVELMTQGETIYDFIDKCDQSALEMVLESKMSSHVITPDLRAVTCRMFMAQNFLNSHAYNRHQMMEIKGCVLKKPVSAPEGSMPEAIFVASVVPHSKPLSNSWEICSFLSVHRLDMRYVEIDHNGCILLGYDSSEIESKSWYESVHPDDIPLAKAKHFEVLQRHKPDSATTFCVRIQSRYGYFVRLQIIMRLQEGKNKQEIVCSNCILKEMDVAKRQNGKGTNEVSRCVAYSGNLRVSSSPELFLGEKCQAQLSENKLDHATHTSGSSCTTTGEIAVQSSLPSSYPLLKLILNRPSIQAYGMTNLEVSLAESLLTPQNSPSDLGQQEFPSNENCLLHMGIPTPEYLPSDFEPSETNSASLECVDQCLVRKQHNSFAPHEFESIKTPPSVDLESETLCFADEEINVSIEAIVDALSEMQHDPEFSKELESVDLSVFCKSFPQLGTQNSSGMKSQGGIHTTSLLNLPVLSPYFDLSLTKLSSAQVENLNKRLSELKKLHETMVFEAVIDVLHDDGNGENGLPVALKDSLNLCAEYETGFGFESGISS